MNANSDRAAAVEDAAGPVSLVGHNTLLGGWNQFWFAPLARRSIVPTRAAICAFAAVYFGQWMATAAVWFGTQGLFDRQLSSKLIAFEETPLWQLWSPLWWSESLWIIQVWLGVGLLLSMAAAVGAGGRVVQTVLVLWTIAWIHRIGWLSGPVEPALVALLGYLVVAPELLLWKADKRLADQPHWLSRTSRRLIQTHVWMLLAGGLASQLAGLVWWRGDAVWWLAASGRSTWLTPEMLNGRAELVNFLTHAVVLVQLLALWLLTIPSGRRVGVISGWISCLCIAAVADQVLYAGLLACGLTAFWDVRTEEH